MERIYSFTVPDNVRSQAVMRKIGMSRVGMAILNIQTYVLITHLVGMYSIILIKKRFLSIPRCKTKVDHGDVTLKFMS